MPAVDFARYFCAPNMLRRARQYGRYLDGQQALTGQETPLLDPDTVTVLRALAMIQNVSDKTVLVPESPTQEVIDSILDAAALLQDALPRDYTKDLAWQAPWDRDLPEHRAVRLRRPYVLRLEDTEHFLGIHEVVVSSTSVTRISESKIEIRPTQDAVISAALLPPRPEHQETGILFFDPDDFSHPSGRPIRSDR